MDKNRLTLSDMLCKLPHAQQRADLEAARIDFVLQGNVIDYTKRYTSTWPTTEQRWLYMRHPQEWFEGLPTFVQKFLVTQVNTMKDSGLIDTSTAHKSPGEWIRYGEGVTDRMNRSWLDQYLKGQVRSIEDLGQERT